MGKAKTAALIFGSVTACLVGGLVATYSSAPLAGSVETDNVKIYDVKNTDLANAAASYSVKTISSLKNHNRSQNMENLKDYSYNSAENFDKIADYIKKKHHRKAVEASVTTTETTATTTTTTTTTTTSTSTSTTTTTATTTSTTTTTTTTATTTTTTVPTTTTTTETTTTTTTVPTTTTTTESTTTTTVPTTTTTVETTVIVTEPAPLPEPPIEEDYQEFYFEEEQNYEEYAYEEIVEETAPIGTEENPLPITQDEYVLLCNAVGHEAGSNWISTYNKALVVEVIMNRVYSPYYPSTVFDVITQPYQFTGSSSYAYLTDYSYEVSEDVVAAVNLYFAEQSSFSHGYLSFYGDGSQNHFS